MADVPARSGQDLSEVLTPLPELTIHAANLPSTVEALRQLLASSERLFDRGVPVRFSRKADGSPSATPMNKNHVIIETHRLCQPMKANGAGEMRPVTLPDRVAQMYLDMGEWGLNPLAGFSMSPLLSPDGGLHAVVGYDRETELWCSAPGMLAVPAIVSRDDALAALKAVRESFRTFPFADSVRIGEEASGLEVVDTSTPPGQDESAFLIGLMTACCRSSLWLAPGVLLTAPSLSGAGSGKGLLVRAICTIAFGSQPRAFTAGADRNELEKRLAAELIEAQPVLFLDNANGMALRSDTLASVLTERPARVRLLGQTLMVPLNSTAFIAVTGNGLTVSEVLARRFLSCRLDARCEDPESRPFRSGFLAEIAMRRAELLGAMLTIWRWGRQNPAELQRGKPLGSFEQWSEWCRDPLISLGCADPVERIEVLKNNDPKRQHVTTIFGAWWKDHGDSPVKVSQLSDAVKETIDGQHRGRQYLATFVGTLAGTHAGGFVLTRQEAAGKWSAVTYALMQANEDGGHRTHRTHPDPARPSRVAAPMSPMTPMPVATDHAAVAAGQEIVL